MYIRRAVEADIPQIDRLLNEVNLVHHNIRPDLFNIGRKYTDNQLKAIIQDDKRPIFAAFGEPDTQRQEHDTGKPEQEPENIPGTGNRTGESLMGYCMTQVQQICGDTIRTDVKTLYIDDLCVDEKSRGQHVGRQLYEYVLHYAKEHGFYNITLHVWAGNDKAAGFYQAMGLVPQYTCLEKIL